MTTQDLPDLALVHPVALELGEEDELLERAHEELEHLQPGSVAVLPELLAWTPGGSERAVAALVEIARGHGLSILTTLNLPPDLVEDLPGREESARYNAVVVFTRHGDLHVPQAKVTPQAFEVSQALSGPGIGVTSYPRVNRVRLDLGDSVIEAIFLVCSDLWLCTRLPPAALACDLLVVQANFAHGAEDHARRVLEAVRAAQVARATLLVNAYHQSKDPSRPPLALRIDELLIADPAPRARRRGTRAPAHPEGWPDPEALADHFRVLDDDAARSYAEMVAAPARAGRIAVPRAQAEVEVEPGTYPITIVL